MADKDEAPQPEELKRIRRCQKGDSQALEEIYLQYHRGVYLFLLSLMRSPETAEDLCQDVFVKLFSQIKSYRFESPFAHWLFRMARNLGIDRMRRDKIRRAVSLDEETPEAHPLAERLAGNSPLPSAASESREEAKAVREAVEELPEVFRTVVVMREWEELSYEDIAKRLKTSEGTVKSRIFRARQMLAGKLKHLI